MVPAGSSWLGRERAADGVSRARKAILTASRLAHAAFPQPHAAIAKSSSPEGIKHLDQLQATAETEMRPGLLLSAAVAPMKRPLDANRIRQECFVTEETESNTDNLIELTAEVVSAYIANNPVPVGELPALIGQVHAALKGTTGSVMSEKSEALKPAVPIRKSVTPDYIISLEDGKKFKSLKRHLSTHHGLTPDDYRAKWGLPVDYPMVAPNYAATRSALAKTMGLGRKPKEPEKPTPAKRPRKKAAA